ncbi:MAG: UDP-N-acetylmuramoyl-tripeptide--D-alanyl-D-alanine ligase [Flavobacteriales bacterium]|nr:UDP-N-acetylmuramoyl-tripeptide--D-alanyl-D-alanine ligase [Flavobacteriales bacterium]
MFFALKGPRFNANALASEALEKGARFAVVDEPEFATDERCILVPDVLAALQELGRYHRRQFGFPVLAITGSNGKTTTKELVHAVLSTDRCTLATEGNLNNHIGVPLTLLRANKDHSFAIIEMGANKPGDIAELMSIAEPTHGVITNIGKAHLEGFGGLDGVVRAKTELFRWLAGHGGAVLVNADDALLMREAGGFEKCITYGNGQACRTQGGLLDSGSCLSLWFRGVSGERFEARTQLIGSYNLPNALAAIAVGQAFGVPDRLIARALEMYSPGNNRSQWKDTGRNQLIMDAYNANPSSVEVALRNFASMETDRPKLAVLGDMLELGPEGKGEHVRMAELCDSLALPVVFVGPLYAEAVGEGAFKDINALLASWAGSAPRDMLIMLKGSRGMRLEQLVPLL